MKFGRPGASGSRDATMGPRINIVLDFENIGHRDIVSLTVTKSVKNHRHGKVGGPGAWGLWKWRYDDRPGILTSC